MKIVVFKGGVGNQLFQYCLIDYLHRCGNKVYYVDETYGHNGLEIDKYFNMRIKKLPSVYFIVYRLIHKFFNRLFVGLSAKDGIFDKSAIRYDGYWQSRKYMADDLSISFKNLPLCDRNRELLDRIHRTDSVCIHIRRGDYLDSGYKNIYGGVCTPDYYYAAVSEISKNTINPAFFVFSDDIEWCRENFRLDNAEYIDWNTGQNSIYDMYLMSFCKSFIIANSTFSYWAAKISGSKNVIYPKKWFAYIAPPDIFPTDWTGL